MSFFTKNKQTKNNSDRLLDIMRENRHRVTISDNGVIQVNLNNDDVKQAIREQFEKLEALEALEA